ncbi:protein-S-isoprenylcysteine O-methyltransferase isoform X2 [Phyllopteryx taeniolatus]|uniref:protein-S-isoprenylcysteine O-methyltransferase isoform X2 n=1 Tax=Phyllopteryx taeniolatus TaxID=161469 RepID=UPI002AD235AE|nr:protein-S-isoprenylcysteine O-methyltransferase isoform X2 [Phyllopteryx taeniolatus]
MQGTSVQGCSKSLLSWSHFWLWSNYKLYRNHLDTFWLGCSCACMHAYSTQIPPCHSIYNNFTEQSMLSPLCRYMCSLAFFHYSEYLVTAIINPRSLSMDSFLLNHSVEYTLAAVSSWLEFTVENLTFPELKQLSWLSFMGLLMVLCGEALRKAAMLTAGSNFNHIVQNEKAYSHVLVTSGVYAFFRHPSYVGWFYWSIGTQVVLCNPVCTLGYTIASWRFFRERIEEEEISLINFFAEEYVEYKKRVPTGLPFISGIRVN